jgi:cobalt-zinc-cadmium resistance protein CzcA
VAEAVSGVKGENSIKLFGNDLQALTDTANKIKAVLATVPALPISRSSPRSASRRCRSTSTVRGRRATALRPGDINATTPVAIGGDSAGDLYEPGSDRHFPIVVRLGAAVQAGSGRSSRTCGIGVQGPERNHPDSR